MGYTSFTTAELGIDKAIKSTTLYKIRGNLEWLRQAYQYNCLNVQNGNFEYETDGLPDLWTCSTYDEGYVGITTATAASGKRSLMFVHVGSTKSGGEALSDYFPMTTLNFNTVLTESSEIGLDYFVWGDTVVDYKVKLISYQGDLTVISTLTETTHATSVTPGAKSQRYVKPTGVRWGRIKFECSTTTTAAGTLYVDNVWAGRSYLNVKYPY